MVFMTLLTTAFMPPYTASRGSPWRLASELMEAMLPGCAGIIFSSAAREQFSTPSKLLRMIFSQNSGVVWMKNISWS